MMNRLYTLLLICLLPITAHAQDSLVLEQAPTKLVVGVKPAPPFVIKNGDEWNGLCVDLWKDIAHDLNIEYTFQEKDLSGLMTSLADSSLDLCINPLTVTHERLEQFDFTQPFYLSNLAIATQSEELGMLDFVSNFFSVGFFRAIFLLFLILAVFGGLFWLAERKQNPEQVRPGAAGLLDGLWWSAVTMTTVGYGDKYPLSPIGKLISIVWMFTAVITISGFTAAISSSLTVEQLESSINSLQDLRQLKPGTVENSSTSELLERNRIKYKSFATVEEGLQAVRNQEIEAFVFDEPILAYQVGTMNATNELSIHQLPIGKQYYSFSLPHNRELRAILNPLILQAIESDDWQEKLNKLNLKQ